MPTRRPHTKTRHGCLTCKARKVRCDEEKPACRNCMRGDRTCSYPNHLLAIPIASTAQPSDSQAQVFPLRDMELLHHWTCHTYMSCTSDPAQHHIWQVIIPTLAFSNRFLLHGMLALAALHRGYQTSDDTQAGSLVDLARYHQQHALTLYIPLLQSLNKDNCHALFALSIVLGALSFGMLYYESDHDLPSAENESIVKRFVNIFDAFMGARAVGVHAHDWLAKGPMGSYMVPLQPAVEVLALPDADFQYALEALLQRARSFETETGQPDGLSKAKTYVKSIMGLGTILSNTPDEITTHVLAAWPVFAEAPYLALLRERDPLALVILGHYGLALHLYGSSLWMLDGLGFRLTSAIFAELDDTWRPYLQWAHGAVASSFSQAMSPLDMPEMSPAVL